MVSQSNNLTGSPYSFFGLGVQSKSSLAGFSALGNTGVAYTENSFINPYNPAAIAFATRQSFLFDIGMLTEINNLSNSTNEELKLSSNFSNVAFGFNGNGTWGVGFRLSPATDVGYSLIGIQTNIEGSLEDFTSNVLGSGGINEMSFDYGKKLWSNFAVGFTASYFFGVIEEQENVIFENNFLDISEESSYTGFQFGLGTIYQIKDGLTIGTNIKFPTVLDGTQDRSIVKSLDFNPFQLEDETGLDIPDFELPWQYSVGVSAMLLKKFNLSMDFTQRLWTATDQRDNIGSFVDQTQWGMGVEYIPDVRGFTYWKKIRYRAGFQYDSGYLDVKDITISNYKITAGLGFPLGRGNSSLNISYDYGNSGTVQGILVEENTHSVHLNVTLTDLWFLQRKID